MSDDLTPELRAEWRALYADMSKSVGLLETRKRLVAVLDALDKAESDVERLADRASRSDRDAYSAEERCGWCGNPATGLASVGDVRYCHGDGDSEPTCYQRRQWAQSDAVPFSDLNAATRRGGMVGTMRDPYKRGDL